MIDAVKQSNAQHMTSTTRRIWPREAITQIDTTQVGTFDNYFALRPTFASAICMICCPRSTPTAQDIKLSGHMGKHSFAATDYDCVGKLRVCFESWSQHRHAHDSVTSTITGHTHTCVALCAFRSVGYRYRTYGKKTKPVK